MYPSPLEMSGFQGGQGIQCKPMRVTEAPVPADARRTELLLLWVGQHGRAGLQYAALQRPRSKSVAVPPGGQHHEGGHGALLVPPCPPGPATPEVRSHREAAQWYASINSLEHASCFALGCLYLITVRLLVWQVVSVGRRPRYIKKCTKQGEGTSGPSVTSNRQ